MIQFLSAAFLLLSASLSGASVSAEQQATTAPPDDAIARVGDQVITFSQLNTMINSSGIVGLSIPTPGSPERDRVRVTLLDKAISANLLYLDALRQGVDKDPRYQRDIERFSDNLLASLYRQDYLIGDIEVTDAEIKEFFENNIAPGTEFTDEVKMAIESVIRKERFQGRKETMRLRIREGSEVVLHEAQLKPEDDEVRMDSEVVATIDDEPILWADIKGRMGAKGSGDTLARRRTVVNQLIDARIMAKKAKAAGLEQNPSYQRKMAEYRKTRLINFHRENLWRSMQPTDQEIDEYFDKHRGQIAAREMRKIQMVVLKTRDEASQVKEMIESGEITIYEAALEYSIDPNVKTTLGEMGWVSKGSGFPELDKLTFSLGPDELGGPVESPAGWHLVKVLDMREAQNMDIKDEKTRKETARRLMHDKLDAYAVKLRTESFAVEVDEAKFQRLSREEAEWMASVMAKEAETGAGDEKLKKQIEQLMQTQP